MILSETKYCVIRLADGNYFSSFTSPGNIESAALYDSDDVNE